MKTFADLQDVKKVLHRCENAVPCLCIDVRQEC